MNNKPLSPGYLAFVVVLAFSVGFLPAGCKDKVPHPETSCSVDAAGNKDCPLQTGVQP